MYCINSFRYFHSLRARQCLSAPARRYQSTSQTDQPLRLFRRVAIVTGSSGGLGRAIALRYASEGAHVVCADLQPTAQPGQNETHHEIGRQGGNSIFVPTDVSDESSVETLVETAITHFGRLDVMVNNAGIAVEAKDPLPIYLSPSQRFTSTMNINSFGVFLGCKYAGMQMMKQDPTVDGDRGWIINIASVLGLVGKAGVIAYSCAKGSVVNMTRTAALDYAPFGIHVNAIAPGFTESPMIAAITQNPTVKAEITSTQPLKGLGKAKDIASAAVFLASNDAAWVTGVCLPVDGGYLLS